MAWFASASSSLALAAPAQSGALCPPCLPLACSAPLVHSGFLCAYTANGFNERLLSRWARSAGWLPRRVVVEVDGNVQLPH